MSGSNLPPGCSSPDGGIDHAMEAAAEELAEALPVMPDDELAAIVDTLELPHFVSAFAKLSTADGKGPMETARIFRNALVTEYQTGHTDAVHECKQIIEAEGRS